MVDAIHELANRIFSHRIDLKLLAMNMLGAIEPLGGRKPDNPNKYGSVTTIAEDENGEVELVEIYN